MKFIQVILPLGINQLFTYHYHQDEVGDLKPGMRVVVPFGTKRKMVGLVWVVDADAPQAYKTKLVVDVLDEIPLWNSNQIKLINWISAYYMVSISDVYRYAMPSAFRLESEAVVRLLDETTGILDLDALSESAVTLWERLKLVQRLAVSEIELMFPDEKPYSIIKSLMDLRLVVMDEVLKEKYRPKKRLWVALAPWDDAQKESRLSHALMHIKGEKQKAIYLALLQNANQPILQSDLIKQFKVNSASIKALENKGLLVVYEHDVSRISVDQTVQSVLPNLSMMQQDAMDKLSTQWVVSNTVLLHGVSASGKSLMYFHWMQSMIKELGVVWMLVPEESLLVQMEFQLKMFFKDKVLVYHAKLNAQEKVEVWRKVAQLTDGIVLTTGIGLLLPFANLKALVVDECHADRFKLKHPTPAINILDSALHLAKSMGAKTLLGTATPSVEMYYAAHLKKIGYVALPKKYHDIPPTPIVMVDLAQSHQRQKMRGLFSQEVLDQCQTILDKKQQVVFYQNKRGYAPVLECQTCGHVNYCPNCDVALTYHQMEHKIKCHYCGHQQAKPIRCPVCQSVSMVPKGIGTEQIELELMDCFKAAKIARMDGETTKRKNAFYDILSDFESGQIDILVGTQMMVNGLDFSNVGLVVIPWADSMIHYPDFRSHEKAFRTLLQLAGRTSRKSVEGQLMIQTYQPLHLVFQKAQLYDLKGFYQLLLKERQQFVYPPYCKIIAIQLKHKKESRVDQSAKWVTNYLVQELPDKSVLGPESPSVAKINNEYIRHILIKISSNHSPAKIKNVLWQVFQKMEAVSMFSKVEWLMDVDPL